VRSHSRRVWKGAAVLEATELVQQDLVPGHEVVELFGTRAIDPDDPLFAPPEFPRMRPVLVALAARAAGATEVDGETQHVAELLHLALGLHDLARGREGGRRRRVARRVLRRSVGLLSGHHLAVRALELAGARRPELSDTIRETLHEFAEGRALVRTLQEGAVPDREDWSHHASTHTGALFAFCCRAGGVVARADGAERLALGRYGRALGRLWHVAEDVTALRHGDPSEHLLARAIEGRPVLPVICAADLDPDLGPAWASLVSSPCPARVEALARCVLAAGGPARAAEVMVREAWVARRALRRLPASRYREALDGLAAGVARAAVRGGPSESVR